jgi:hypothetical protein
VHVVVAPRWASEPARSGRRRAIAKTFVGSVWARVAARRLDARLAAGCRARYRTAYREELYELARAALFALGSREAGPFRR